jgi:single-strand DNA-binding protein
MLPRIELEGVVVADPELRFSQSGKGWVKMRVVASDRKRGANGEWEDGAACFLDVKAFDQMAENIAETFVKGTKVLVVGRLNPEEWTTTEGEKRTGYSILVDAIGPSVRWDAWSKHSTERAASTTPANDPWATPTQNDEPPW